jgi:hypothetical protein
MLTIYILVIRAAFWLFINTYNDYNIRLYVELPSYINSIPEILYTYPEEEGTDFYSITLDTDYLVIRE